MEGNECIEAYVTLNVERQMIIAMVANNMLAAINHSLMLLFEAMLKWTNGLSIALLGEIIIIY